MGHREVFAAHLEAQELRYKNHAAERGFRHLIQFMTRGVYSLSALTPYNTAIDDAWNARNSVASQLSIHEVMYDQLYGYWVEEVGGLLAGRIIKATATGSNPHGFQIHTAHGPVSGLTIGEVEGKFHSYDPLAAILRLGSEEGGAVIQLVTPGDIFRCQASIEVFE